MELKRIRERCLKFIQEISKEHYLAYSGQSDTINIEKVYDKYNDLSEPDLLKDLLKQKERLRNEEERKVRYLSMLIGELTESRKTVALSDKIGEKKASAKIFFNGEEVSYYQASAMIESISEREKRKELLDKINVITDETNDEVKNLWDISHELARYFDYDNYVDFWSKLKGVDYETLAEGMDWFISESESTYRELLSEMAIVELGLEIDKIEPYDTRYLFNMFRFRDQLPGDELIKVVETWTNEWGIDPTAYGNVTFDTETRKRKSPRAFCAPVRVPDEVYLVIMPRGGFSDYKSFLHELGHALHYGFANSKYPMEYLYLGDNAVTEAYAFTFDHMMVNPLWVKRYLSLKDPQLFTRYSITYSIFMLRRYGAKIRYELIFHRDGKDSDMRMTYSDLLRKSTLMKQNDVNYLQDIDANMYVASYLRAWILEAQLNMYLTENYDEDWFRNPKASNFMLDLFSMGQKYTADEIARQLGYKGLEVEYMWRRLINTLNDL
ncbi:MAG: hypothetical protein DRH49_05970 [Candidatus Coatesbacteria bacterium]|nr:MAG: hypothetical protein DRH49_05970 [Candidatus Coatesbacteria bacterium]